jgi:hypothetical protein
MLWVTGAALLRRPTANGYDPLALERLVLCRLLMAKGERWGALYKVEQPDAPILVAMNVDRLVSSKALETPKPGSEWLLLRDSPRYVYARRESSSRAFFAESVARTGNMQEALAKIRNDPAWDPRRQVVVEESAGPQHSIASVGQVQVASYRPGEIRLRTSNTTTTFLYISEAFYPGWTATVDEAPVGVRAANVAFQGAWAPAGDHAVVFRYDPGPFRLGACISLVAAGLAVALASTSQRSPGLSKFGVS